ncbi:MAG TPA: hypothetical protein VHE59_04460 [Mucilaginibacter sp.]|nr:hypothetical protein [Mucilaginibacter sp.]
MLTINLCGEYKRYLFLNGCFVSPRNKQKIFCSFLKYRISRMMGMSAGLLHEENMASGYCKIRRQQKVGEELSRLDLTEHRDGLFGLKFAKKLLQ